MSKRHEQKVLMVSPVIPNASGAGIQRRAAVHLKALSRHGRVSLLVFEADHDGTSAVPNDIQALCHSTALVRNDGPPSFPAFNVPGYLLGRELLRMGRFWHLPPESAFAQAQHIALAEVYDTVFCFRVRAALALLELERRFPFRSGRRFVDFDDIESLAIARSLGYLAKKIGREQTLVRRIRGARLRKVEDSLLRQFDSTLVCSVSDRDILASRVPSANIHVIHNCVRLDEVPERPDPNNVCKFLFVGTMNYEPNVDAVQWFCKNIWGKIRDAASQPSIFLIVGRSPTADVRALGEIEGVTVVGGVEDVSPFYRESDIVVAPIRFGSGTRIKIVEAMSMAMPVVSTTVGAEGLEVVANRDILISDTEERFAEACLALISDGDLRMRMGNEARKTVEMKYAEEVVVSEVLKCLAAE